jgi:hypothetical protein
LRHGRSLRSWGAVGEVRVGAVDQRHPAEAGV